jgi:hypothetical protein
MRVLWILIPGFLVLPAITGGASPFEESKVDMHVEGLPQESTEADR